MLERKKPAAHHAALRLVVDNGSRHIARALHSPRGKIRQHGEGHLRDASTLSGADDRRPPGGRDAVPQVPLFDDARANAKVGRKLGAGRPGRDDVSEAIHGSTVQNVPTLSSTHCTEDLDTICAMRLPDLDSPGDRLRWARQQRYTSMAEACRAFGWNENTYKTYEAGTRGISEARAQEFAKRLGVSWLWLLHGNSAIFNQFSADEIALIEKYRRKSSEARQAAHNVLDAFPDERQEAG